MMMKSLSFKIFVAPLIGLLFVASAPATVSAQNQTPDNYYEGYLPEDVTQSDEDFLQEQEDYFNNPEAYQARFAPEEVNVTPRETRASGPYRTISNFPFSCNTFGECLQTLFIMGVTAASVIAVVAVIIGGIEYMGSESVFKKSKGKERILYALGGLLIALISVLLLTTILPSSNGGEGGDFQVNIDF